MALDADFDQLSREHSERKRTYRKRTDSSLRNLNIQITQQHYADLKAMAATAEVSMGEFVDGLIGRAVQRRARRMAQTNEAA